MDNVTSEIETTTTKKSLTLYRSNILKFWGQKTNILDKKRIHPNFGDENNVLSLQKNTQSLPFQVDSYTFQGIKRKERGRKGWSSERDKLSI